MTVPSRSVTNIQKFFIFLIESLIADDIPILPPPVFSGFHVTWT